ncbi:GDSL-type esterase/lipase family protein [Leifsonia sp. NPDC058230]|uniref:GDSL-type esterase/lipase family protein n=1 Tax=Leifsonia sp. NPDC058230 TaxID=3346391 RepID=UPI0036D9BADE
MTGPVVFLGDSLTYGGKWDEWFSELDARNFGIGGNKASDVLKRLDAVIELEPSLVVLMLGTNDIGQPDLTTIDIAAGYAQILARLRLESSASVIVQSAPPRQAQWAAPLRELNNRYRSLADAFGHGYLDVWPVFSADGVELDGPLTTDGVHFTDEGYDRWMSVLRPMVEREISAS